MNKDETVFIGIFDSEKCSACSSRAPVACMDQNDIDIPAGGAALPPNFTLEGKTRTCILASPVSCIMSTRLSQGLPLQHYQGRRVRDSRLYDTTNSIGCHSCAVACPYGDSVLAPDGKMRKCDACIERQKAGDGAACRSLPHRRPDPDRRR